MNENENIVRATYVIKGNKAVMYGNTAGGGKEVYVFETEADFDAAIAAGTIPDGALVVKTYDGDEIPVSQIIPELSETSESAVQSKAIYAVIKQTRDAIDQVQTDMLSDKNHIAKALAGYNGKDLGQIYTPAQFKAKVESGDFSGTDLGDYFDITLTTNEKIRYAISGYNPYLNYGDNPVLTANHVIMTSVDCMAETAKMNETNTNVGGYAGSLMPAYLEGVLATFPEEWRAVMRPIRRLENNKGTFSWNTRTLFLLSETEVNGRFIFSSAHDAFSRPIPLYQFSARYRIKGYGFGSSANGNRQIWWTASPNDSDADHFCTTSTRGEAGSNSTGYSLGIAPAFII